MAQPTRTDIPSQLVISMKYLPPGEHPLDPLKAEIDVLLFSVGRLKTHIVWADEYFSTFKKLRHDEPEAAEQELVYLSESLEDARRHLKRLTQLLLDGATIDPTKKIPSGLDRKEWLEDPPTS